MEKILSLVHARPTMDFIDQDNWQAVINLEEQIFPGSTTVFNFDDLRRLSAIQPTFLVGIFDRSQVRGYFSSLLLNTKALDFCLSNNITSICKLPEELLLCPPNECRAIFYEVIAVTPELDRSSRLPLLELFSESLAAFSHLPGLTCPVTKAGLHLVQKRGFSPVSRGGLNELYLIGPWSSSNGRKQME
jgi:hypothetical protein